MLMFRFYNDALNAACGTPGEWRASVLEVGIRVTFTIDLVDPNTPSSGLVRDAGVCKRVRAVLHHPGLVQLSHLDLLQAQGQICQG